MTPEEQEVAFRHFFATVVDGAEFYLDVLPGCFAVCAETSAGTFKFTASQARDVADYVDNLGLLSGDTRTGVVSASLRIQADEADAMEAEFQ